MPVRQVQARPKKKIPVGDFRDRVAVQVRQLVPGGLNGSTTTRLTTVASRWTKIETVNGFSQGLLLRQGVQVQEMPSHKITIRHPSFELTTDHVIRDARGALYRIMAWDDLDERQEYLVIFMRHTGLDTREAAKA